MLRDPSESLRRLARRDRRQGRRPRAGTTYLEVVIAISITGVTLAGLGSAVYSQLRLLRAIENRQALFLPQGAAIGATPTASSPELVVTYSGAVEPDDGTLRGAAASWARRLGVARLGTFLPVPNESWTWPPALEVVPAPESIPFPPEAERNLVRLVEPGLLHEGIPPVLFRTVVQVIEPGPPPEPEP